MSALDHPEQYGSYAPIWLLTLAACGRTWRIASEFCTVESDDGDLVFDAGIDDLTVDEALGEPGDDPGEPIASFDELHLDGAVEATTYGQDLTAGRGEVSLWLPGTDWEDRRVLVSGRIRSASVGRDDLCSVTIGDTLDIDRGRVIEAGAIIDAETWSAAADDAVGNAYPLPFGTPGVYTGSDGSALEVAASPAPMVDATGSAEILLIAGEQVAASNVTIVDLDDGTSDSFAVSEVADGRGRTVAVVDLSTPGSLTVDASHSYGVIFDQDGGILSDRAEVLTGAGDLVTRTLARSTLPIDYSAWSAVRGELNAYAVAGYIDDPDASPMDWIADNVLPLLPITLLFGSGGVAPFLWPTQLTANDAEIAVDAADHAGDLELDGDRPERVGEFTPEQSIRYAFALDGDSHRRLQTLTGDPAAEPSSIMAPTAQLRAIWLAHVARTGSDFPAIAEIETDIIGDDLTASKVLGWRAELLAAPRLRPRYQASWAFGWVRLGMIASITDATIGLSGALGVIDAITWSSLGPTFTIRLQTDVARDLSAT